MARTKLQITVSNGLRTSGVAVKVGFENHEVRASNRRLAKDFEATIELLTHLPLRRIRLAARASDVVGGVETQEQLDLLAAEDSEVKAICSPGLCRHRICVGLLHASYDCTTHNLLKLFALAKAAGGGYREQMPGHHAYVDGLLGVILGLLL